MDRAGEGESLQARASSRRGERPNAVRVSAIAGALALHAWLLLAVTLPVNPFERSAYVPAGDPLVIQIPYPEIPDPPGCGGLRFPARPPNLTAIAQHVRVSIDPTPTLPLSVPSLLDTLRLPPVHYRASVDRPLQAVASPAPVYPRKALRAGLSGSVEIEVVVGIDGVPLSARIARSSGHHALDEAALAAVLSGWRFQPRMRDGEAVEAVARVPIDFVLPGRVARG
ncbi:energy transducer TonB [Lysobacter capsici]|uniref:energy transducer TonB n=1 Tax=Lysobacter capsici TaxID=435897 RepID=UPI001BFFE5DB|nr:energy transducer TonB [Lysobacter capsici]QWF16300.1 energy transducer TonB [Lysobacter capsici]